MLGTWLKLPLLFISELHQNLLLVRSGIQELEFSRSSSNIHFFTSWDLEEEEAEADLEKLVYILQQLPRAGLISTVFQWFCLRALAPCCNWALQLYQLSAGLRFDADFQLHKN